MSDVVYWHRSSFSNNYCKISLKNRQQIWEHGEKFWHDIRRGGPDVIYPNGRKEFKDKVQARL